jgi:WD40 repeat protein
MSKFQAGIRSLDYNEQSKTILAGTRGSEIIELGINGNKLKTLIYGHFEGTPKAELWGCAVHPSQQLFATCGADCTIRIWKDNEMVLSSDPFNVDLTAVDWASNG